MKKKNTKVNQMKTKPIKKLKIIITGSSGFIGSHLLQELQKDKDRYQPLGLDKKMSKSADITDYRTVVAVINKLMGKPDLIVHLAGTCSTSKSLDKPHEDFNDNLIGTFNMLELCRVANIPLIYTSTCKAEANEQGVRTPYGLSKYAAELYVEEYNKTFGVDYVINRPGTVYGPGQEGSTESGWIAWFVKAAKEKLPITIYGDGEQTRDILFVKDYVALLMDQINHFAKYKNETYSVGGGVSNEISVKGLLDGVLEYTNYNFGKERHGDSKRYVSDNTKVTAVNGWVPTTGNNEGLKLTINNK